MIALRNILCVLPILYATTTVAQCQNQACETANFIYKSCLFLSAEAFKRCLCTSQFKVNYTRCMIALPCRWDGDPATLDVPCTGFPSLYCPGTFQGGFDATAYCTEPTTTIRPTSTVRTSASTSLGATTGSRTTSRII